MDTIRRSTEFLSGTGAEAGARGTEAGSRLRGKMSLLTHFLSLLQATDMGQPSSVMNMHAYPSTHAQHMPATQELHTNLPLHIDTLMCTPLEQMPLVSLPTCWSTLCPLPPAPLTTANPCDSAQGFSVDNRACWPARQAGGHSTSNRLELEDKVPSPLSPRLG